MTIVQPYKRTPLGILFFWLMGFVISGIALYGIILYNQLVDIRHDVSAIHQNVRRAEVMNAELKNTLANKTDPESMRITRVLKMPDLSRTPGSPINELARRITALE